VPARGAPKTQFDSAKARPQARQAALTKRLGAVFPAGGGTCSPLTDLFRGPYPGAVRCQQRGGWAGWATFNRFPSPKSSPYRLADKKIGKIITGIKDRASDSTEVVDGRGEIVQAAQYPQKPKPMSKLSHRSSIAVPPSFGFHGDHPIKGIRPLFPLWSVRAKIFNPGIGGASHGGRERGKGGRGNRVASLPLPNKGRHPRHFSRRPPVGSGRRQDRFGRGSVKFNYRVFPPKGFSWGAGRQESGKLKLIRPGTRGARTAAPQHP